MHSPVPRSQVPRSHGARSLQGSGLQLPSAQYVRGRQSSFDSQELGLRQMPSRQTPGSQSSSALQLCRARHDPFEQAYPGRQSLVSSQLDGLMHAPESGSHSPKAQFAESHGSPPHADASMTNEAASISNDVASGLVCSRMYCMSCPVVAPTSVHCIHVTDVSCRVAEAFVLGTLRPDLCGRTGARPSQFIAFTGS